MAQTPISVAIVTGSLSRQAGGLFHSVRQLAQGLEAEGVRVGVFGLRDADTEKDLSAWGPIEPVALHPTPTAGVGFAKGLHAALSSFQPSIIHQHGIWQGFSRTVSAWSSKVPTVVSPRGMLDPWAIQNSNFKKKLAWCGWEEKNLIEAASIHALAESEAEAIKQAIPTANIVVIPNAVSLPKETTKSGKNSGKRSLLFLGRIHPKKGLRELVLQWSQLSLVQRNAWSVTVAGPDEGGHRKELESLVKELKLEGSFNFIGPVIAGAKDALLRESDAFILPSHSEGLPMSVLEAWSYGLPVLMTKACNLPEGFSANAALEIDHDPSAKKLALALSRDRLEILGQNGTTLVKTRFALPMIVRSHLENYQTLLEHRREVRCQN